jgi:NAD(P) transhydrogenase subunit beta
MTLTSAALAVYLVAAVLFVASLAGLSAQATARRGTVFGITGMTLSIVATIALALERSARPWPQTAGLILLVLVIGAAVGTWRARRVEMTQMPELIALLHSFVGASAVLVGYGSYLATPAGEAGDAVHRVEVFLGVLVGAVTFTGSVVAFGKLSGRLASAPLTLPGRNVLNLLALVVAAALLGWFLAAGPGGIVPLLAMTAVALALGWHLVAAIGGGDMPVVISMLNSYSGWAAGAGRGAPRHPRGGGAGAHVGAARALHNIHNGLCVNKK